MVNLPATRVILPDVSSVSGVYSIRCCSYARQKNANYSDEIWVTVTSSVSVTALVTTAVTAAVTKAVTAAVTKALCEVRLVRQLLRRNLRRIYRAVITSSSTSLTTPSTIVHVSWILEREAIHEAPKLGIETYHICQRSNQ